MSGSCPVRPHIETVPAPSLLPGRGRIPDRYRVAEWALDAGSALRRHRLADTDGVLAFDAKLDLSGYDLPDDAYVFVEAYRQTTFMRFSHGTVAAPRTPRGIAHRLTEFATRDGLLFRLKVTSAGDCAGVLLAESDRIPLSDDEEQPDKRIALLPPAPGELGQEPWRVDLTGASGPLLW